MLTSMRPHMRAQIEFGVRLSLLGGLALIVLGNDGTRSLSLLHALWHARAADAAVHRGA